ncbi:hypothetical protein KAW50_04650 [candidate division WOR-3 bacterium]|nr:hypothetical protein [candidate division WOR-3 bacterium]
MGNYIPRSSGRFNTWQKSYVAYIVANASALGIAPSDVAKLQSAQVDWSNKFRANMEAQNAAHGTIESRDKSLDAFVIIVRQMTRGVQARAETTDGQREGLGITVPDRIKTPLSEQIVQNETPPVIEAVCTSPRQVRIDWRPSQSGTDSEAKPKGIDGVAIWYAEGGIPTDIAEWRFLALDTNSPYIHSVGNDKTVTLAYKAQWFDKRKRMGAFGNPVTVAVTG